jgi:hypothetical protein
VALSQGSRICGVPCGQDHRAVHLRVQRLEVFQLDVGQRAASATSMSRSTVTLEVRVVVDHRQFGAELVRDWR